MIPYATRPAEILVVEDNPLDFELLRMALDRLPLELHVHHARDGAAALALLEDRDRPRPDLILLDLNMPGIDGAGVLERVKSDPSLRTIPVIVLTSSSALEDVQATYRRRANGFLSKPYSAEEVDDLLGALSTFWFSIVKPVPDPSRSQRPRAETGFHKIVRNCPARILLVEDDDLYAEMVVQEAAHWFRHPVARARDAEEALAHLLAADPRPHVVLLDLGLPGPGGLDVLRAIRQDPDLAALQVIVFTVRDDDESVIESYQSHVNAFVQKPSSPEDLWRILLSIAHWYSVVRTV